MSPELKIRITGKNETSGAFEQVKQDAAQAAGAVEAAGRRANTALAGQSRGLRVLGDSSAAAAQQQKNLLFQLNDIGVSLAGGANPLMVLAQQGGQVASIYGPNEGGLGRAFQETGKLAAGMISKFWPIAALVGVGTAAIAGMTAEINKAGGQQVSFGDVAMATWQEFSDGVYTLVQPAISAISGWIGDAWNFTWPILKDVGNGIISTFVGSFNSIKDVWSQLPGAIGDVAYQAAGNVFDAVSKMVNDNLQTINNGLTALRAFAPFLPAFVMPMKGGRPDNPFGGQAEGAGKTIGSDFTSAFGTDYLGQAFEGISKRAKALASANKDIEGVKTAADAASKSIAEMGSASAGAAADMASHMQDGLGTFSDFASEASGLLGQIFEGNKGFAIAGAVLDASAGIAKTLGAYPFPFNIGMAALHAAAAVAQIAKIQSTTKSSRSVGGAPAGGSAPSVQAGAAGGGGGGGAINVTLIGDYFGPQAMMGMFKQMQEAMGLQGKQILVSHKSGV